jgi:predicted ATPase/DNA-binding SARP family transcriptional activator
VLEVYLLGTFELRQDGAMLVPTWPRRHARDVLQLLALQPQFRLHREQVIEAIWPDEDAEKRLYYVVHALRKALEPMLSQGSSSRYVNYKDGILELQNVWVDAQAFEEKLTEASNTSNDKQLARALELYKGNLLSDNLYTPWLETERERLKQRYVAGLGQLAELYQGDAGATLKFLERLVTAEPSEAHYRKLIGHQLQQGNVHEANRHYQRCLELLRDVGLAPEAETKQLFETLRQQQQRPILPVNVSSFPLVSTPLLGRERELSEVSKLLETSRLVTLTGVAGVGKTRLALELAGSLQHHYSHSVVTLSLAALQVPELLMPALRQVLGVSGEVASHLKDKQMLLVLDNCEHLLEAMPTVAGLLESAPLLSVLATSRTPLHLRGESCFEVLPLDEQSAVELFVARVQAAQPKFVATPKERADIMKLCHALDDLPLAIELASSRATLDIVTIRQHLHERLDFQHSERNAPERHRSLRAALEWSYELLPEGSQKLFRTLGGFAGRVDMPMLAGICQDKNLLASLEPLLDHHLVIAAKTSEGSHFDLLETVRVYAKELLEGSSEREDSHQRHADYFLNLVIEAEKHRDDAQQKDYLDKLEAVYPEIRAALEYLIEAKPEQALRFIMDLGHFWYARAYHAEGKQWNVKALPFATIEETRFGIYRGLAGLSSAEGNAREAKHYIEQCLDLPYATNQARRHAGTLGNLATLTAQLDGLAQAQPLYEKAIALLETDQELPALSIKGTALYNLGSFFVEEGRWDEAEPLLEQALEFHQKLRFEQGMAHELNALAMIALGRQDLDAAEALAKRSLELCERLGYESLAAAVWVRLGLIDLARHDLDKTHSLDKALEKLLRGLETAKHADTTTFANALLALSAWGTAKGEDQWATQLLSLAQQMQDETGRQFPRYKESLYCLTREQLLERLGERAFKTAWQLGATQRLEDILSVLPKTESIKPESTKPESTKTKTKDLVL